MAVHARSSHFSRSLLRIPSQSAQGEHGVEPLDPAGSGLRSASQSQRSDDFVLLPEGGVDDFFPAIRICRPPRRWQPVSPPAGRPSPHRSSWHRRRTSWASNSVKRFGILLGECRQWFQKRVRALLVKSATFQEISQQDHFLAVERRHPRRCCAPSSVNRLKCFSTHPG